MAADVGFGNFSIGSVIGMEINRIICDVVTQIGEVDAIIGFETKEELVRNFSFIQHLSKMDFSMMTNPQIEKEINKVRVIANEAIRNAFIVINPNNKMKIFDYNLKSYVLPLIKWGVNIQEPRCCFFPKELVEEPRVGKRILMPLNGRPVVLWIEFDENSLGECQDLGEREIEVIVKDPEAYYILERQFALPDAAGACFVM